MTEKINKKILFVEDDEDFLFILKTKFTNEGFAVFTAENGEAALEVVEKEKPDMVVTDVLMPKMNGIDMAKKIRETDKDVPVLFLTNLKDTEYTDDIKKIDKAEILIKSETRIDDIVEKVKTKLGIK